MNKTIFKLAAWIVVKYLLRRKWSKEQTGEIITMAEQFSTNLNEAIAAMKQENAESLLAEKAG
jgi:hypothetical protein